MIILNTDMPKKCMDCQLLGHDEMYCTLYPRKDLDVITVATSKPNWCPIKCDVNDVNDIKAKIKMEITASWYKGKHEEYRDGLDKALEIIDEHIGKE